MGGSALIHFRLRYERLRDHLGSARRRALLLRALWLALMLPAAGLLLHIAGAAPLAPRAWLVGAGLAFFLAWGWLSRSARRANLERDLDRRFGLDELLVTAVEVDRRGARGAVEVRLLDDAATTVAELGDARQLTGNGSRREAEMLVGLGLVWVGLWLLAGTLAGLPVLDRLPGLPSPDGDLVGPEGPGAGPQGPGRASAAGARLACVLGDHAAAREIANALAAGNPKAAAKAARSLADRVGGLSEAGRRALAAALAEASRDLEALDPDLAEALDAAQKALESEDPSDRAAGIDRLADELDALEELRRDASPLPVEVSQRLGPPLDALAPDARPLGLKASGRAGAPRSVGRSRAGGGTTRAIEREAASSSAAPAGRLELGRLELGRDPQRLPWELRATVRDYFAPELRAP